MAAERTSMRHVREVLRLKFPLPDDIDRRRARGAIDSRGPARVTSSESAGGPYTGSSLERHVS